MKPKELRDLTYSELEHRLRETKESLFNLRVELSSGKLENPLKIREVRRDLARIKTIMKEKGDRLLLEKEKEKSENSG